MLYEHEGCDGNKIDLPAGKVVCVGRNYAAHAQELNNPVPDEPLLFIKPSTALTPFSNQLDATNAPHRLHYELEIAALIKHTLKNASHEDAEEAIYGLGLALDLTYRELQSELKTKGYPWEKAKAFDLSCPTSQFINASDCDLNSLYLELQVNDELRQSACSNEMLVDIVSLLVHASSHFTLLPGDILLTGTPAGVGSFNVGDKLVARLDELICVQTSVI